jgi:hypothetical protein
MTTIQESFAILMLVALASQAGADVRHRAPGAGADVLHQQDTGIVEEEEEDEEEDEEPDCE